MTEREMLLKRLASYDFASVEMKLYLDTHPWDVDAMRKMQEFEAKSNTIRTEYEATFGPVCKECSASHHAWMKTPWPWEGGEV